jgi:hypothetical protein
MRASPLGYKQTLRLVLLVVLACIGPLLLSVQVGRGSPTTLRSGRVCVWVHKGDTCAVSS